MALGIILTAQVSLGLQTIMYVSHGVCSLRCMLSYPLLHFENGGIQSCFHANPAFVHIHEILPYTPGSNIHAHCITTLAHMSKTYNGHQMGPCFLHARRM